MTATVAIYPMLPLLTSSELAGPPNRDCNFDLKREFSVAKEIAIPRCPDTAAVSMKKAKSIGWSACLLDLASSAILFVRTLFTH